MLGLGGKPSIGGKLKQTMALNQSKILQRSLIWVLASAIGGTVWLAADRFNEQRVKARTIAHVQEIISLLDLESTPEFHQRLDKVRTFINDNSIHKIDRAFWVNHANPSSFAAGLLAHAKGVAEPVHMECSTRTNLLGLVLQAPSEMTKLPTALPIARKPSRQEYCDCPKDALMIWL